MAELPEYKRTTTVSGAGSTPDFGSAMRGYAQATWGSFAEIGSNVAQAASNEMAAQVGTQLGKDPQGDLMPPITDFDKHVSETYSSQAHATLGLQAQSLMTDAQTTLAKQPRLSPEMINQTQAQVAQGLDSIYKLAPSTIRPQLEYQFGSTLISQRQQLQNRMISEGRQDQHDNVVAYSNNAAQQAYNLSAKGDEKGAQSYLDTVKQMNNNGVANATVDKNMARVNIETVQNSLLAGRETFNAMQAKKDGKLPEYFKNYAENPPKGMTFTQWQATGQSVMQNMQFYDNLEKQDQALRLSRLNLAMTKDITSITGSVLEEARQNLPEDVYNNWETSYRKQLAKNSETNNNVAGAIAGISDPNKWPVYSDKVQYQAMQNLAQKKVEDSMATGAPLTMPEAMAQVAATAASPNTSYMSTLNSKASSSNPQFLQEAGAAISYINGVGKPQNVSGIDDKALANLEMFNALKGSHDPVTAAQMAHDTVYNKTQEQYEANKNNWLQHIKDNTGKGVTPESFALSQANIPPGTLVNPNLVGDFVKQKYEAYFNYTNGNVEVAQKLLQDDIAKTFGTTNVNGVPQFDMYPIEKVYNLPDDALPFVSNDLIRQASEQFKRSKELYDSGASSFYWEVRQDVDIDSVIAARKRVDEISQEQFRSPVSKGVFDITNLRTEKAAALKTIEEFNTSRPKAVQHFADGRTQEYELVIRGNQTLGTTSAAEPGQPLSGYYDVNLKSGKAIIPIINADPSSGPIRYSPNVKAIIEDRARVYPTRTDYAMTKLTDNPLATIAASGKGL